VLQGCAHAAAQWRDSRIALHNSEQGGSGAGHMLANHVCRDAALPGTLAVLAGLVLGVNAWGGFHWDYSDVSRGIIAAAPLCFVCEHHSRRCPASDRPNGLAALCHVVAVMQLCLLTNTLSKWQCPTDSLRRAMYG
jgi:hypothetical protein